MADEDGVEFDITDPGKYFDHVPDRLPAGCATSPLLRLPPELLTLIVEHCLVQDRSLDLNTLKLLRLVHPLIAHLSVIKTILFRSILLTSDPDRLRAFEKGFQASGVAKYIRHVAFESVIVSRYSLPKERQSDHTSKIETLLKPRVSRAVDSGRTLRTWISILESLSEPLAYHICNNLESSYYNKIHCGPSPHTLLDLALQAITAANSTPSEFRLQHRTHDEFMYTKLADGFEALDLSELRVLEFEAHVQTVSRDWDYRKSFCAETTAVLMHFLHRSVSTLRELKLSNNDSDTVEALIDTRPPMLPVLQSFDISHGRLKPQYLASNWLANMPRLRHFSLRHVVVAPDAELGSWFPIFHALREHPGQPSVTLLGIFLHSAAGYHAKLDLHHQIPDTPTQEKQGHPIMGEIADMIKMFLSGLDEWGIEDYWSADHFVDSDEDEDWNSDMDLPTDEDEAADAPWISYVAAFGDAYAPFDDM